MTQMTGPQQKQLVDLLVEHLSEQSHLDHALLHAGLGNLSDFSADGTLGEMTIETVRKLSSRFHVVEFVDSVLQGGFLNGHCPPIEAWLASNRDELLRRKNSPAVTELIQRTNFSPMWLVFASVSMLSFMIVLFIFIWSYWMDKPRLPITESGKEFVEKYADAQRNGRVKVFIKEFDQRFIGRTTGDDKWQLWFVDNPLSEKPELRLSASADKSAPHIYAKWGQPLNSTPDNLNWMRLSAGKISFRMDGTPVLQDMSTRNIHCTLDVCRYLSDRETLLQTPQMTNQVSRIRAIQNNGAVKVWTTWNLQLMWTNSTGNDWTECIPLDANGSSCSGDAKIKLDTYTNKDSHKLMDVVKVTGWLEEHPDSITSLFDSKDASE